jgi:hypothetical protein
LNYAISLVKIKQAIIKFPLHEAPGQKSQHVGILNQLINNHRLITGLPYRCYVIHDHQCSGIPALSKEKNYIKVKFTAHMHHISYLQAKIQSSNSRCYVTGDHHISLLNREYTVEKSHVHYTFYAGYTIILCL